MIQIPRNLQPARSALYASILDEIIAAHASHIVVDELGLAISTHPGSKRARNEDRLAVARISRPNGLTYTVALVCDGVGGSQMGDQAACLAIASVIGDLAQQLDQAPLRDIAVSLVMRADDLVRNELQGRGATTLVMLLASSEGELVCTNVGDSRAYSWDSKVNQLVQVTIDDTIENELKDLPGDHTALINARGMRGRLSQAIGEAGRTAKDLRVQTHSGERFLQGAVLGSDGLWRAAQDFEAVVANSASPSDVARRAIALASWVGGVDNASIIAISEVSLLCGLQQPKLSGGLRRPEVVLWSTGSTVKIICADLQDAIRAVQPHDKGDKPKRTARKKPSRAVGAESQLNLDEVEPKNPRPKIEVTVGEGPKENS
jgi:serine/threonine protein phosphatase PrpC